MYKNLATFDPTTYYLLLQFRVVITGVLFQVIFRFFAKASYNLALNICAKLIANLFPFRIHFAGDIPQVINETTMVFVDSVNPWLHAEASAIRWSIRYWIQ